MSLVIAVTGCATHEYQRLYCQVAGIYFNQVDTEMAVTKEDSDPQKEQAWPALQDPVGSTRVSPGGRARGRRGRVLWFLYGRNRQGRESRPRAGEVLTVSVGPGADGLFP